MNNTSDFQFAVKIFGIALRELDYFYETPYNKRIKDNLVTAFHEWKNQSFDKSIVKFVPLDERKTDILITICDTSEKYVIHYAEDNEPLIQFKRLSNHEVLTEERDLLKTYIKGEIKETCIWRGARESCYLSLSYRPPQDGGSPNWRWSIQFRVDSDTNTDNERNFNVVRANRCDLFRNTGTTTSRQLIRWLSEHFQGHGIPEQFVQYCEKNAIPYQVIVNHYFGD